MTSITDGLSARQEELFWLASHDERLVAAQGTVRSGKTHGGLGGLMNYAGCYFDDAEFLVSARSQRQLNAVVIREMRQWSRRLGCGLVKKEDHWQTRNRRGGTNRWYTAIGNDASAVDKIQGMTLAGAYLDEVVKMPREFVIEVDFRCSDDGARIVHTMNPEGSRHWYKREFLDTGNAKSITFSFGDNPSLSEAYVQGLKERYPSGTIARRKLEGVWCDEAGNVWDITRNVRRHPRSDPLRLEAGVDTASASVTHAILFARYPEGTWAVDEWRHDAREDGKLAHKAQVERMTKYFAAGWGSPSRYVVDPSSSDFILHLANKVGNKRVVRGVNKVYDGIQTVRWMLERGRVMIDHECEYLRNDIAGYMWDEKAAARGEDRPTKIDDHGCDAFRYYCVDRARRQRRARQAPKFAKGAGR